jgi:hypothetical protein
MTQILYSKSPDDALHNRQAHAQSLAAGIGAHAPRPIFDDHHYAIFLERSP